MQPTANLDIKFNRTQFPLLPAAARTGVRTQSTTLPMLAADPVPRGQKHGYVYSICTRTTSKEGLFLLQPVTLDMFTPEAAVLQEIQRLRKEARLSLAVPDFAQPGLHLATHNVSSLAAHHADITAPCNALCNAHCIHVCETRDLSQVQAQLDNHTVLISTPDLQGSALMLRHPSPATVAPD